MFFFRKQKFEGGHKKFEGKATRYVENPKDLQHLLKRAIRKAGHNKSSLSSVLQQLYDLIPDFIIGLGIIDDVAVIGFTVKQLSIELDRFKNWKENSPTIL